MGGNAASGPAGSNGSARGGAVYADGSVTLQQTIFDNNGAYGGASGITLTGATGGGDGPNGGGGGGAGGNAYGGALYLDTSSALTSTDAAFEENQAFGGNGGTGFEITDPSNTGGTRGGGGGAGGNAYGGAIYSQSINALSLAFNAFHENMVLGGRGGRGGDGNANNGSGSLGGYGGNGANGGSAFGGAVDLEALVEFVRGQFESVGGSAAIQQSQFVGNQVGAGDGGPGGDGGLGGSGSSDGNDPSQTYYGGAGGNAGNGGNGGNAYGGAVNNNGAALTLQADSLTGNQAMSGWGGDGGFGGPGNWATDYQENDGAEGAFGTQYKNTDGGGGGSGGNGGNAGNAYGGGLSVISGTALVQNTSLLNNTLVAGFGGDGGQGGNAGGAADDGTDGNGGTGGNGGNGGNAQGGGLWVGQGASVQSINVTAAGNIVQSGGAGQGNVGGGLAGNPTFEHLTTREDTSLGDVQGNAFAIGGSEGVLLTLIGPGNLALIVSSVGKGILKGIKNFNRPSRGVDVNVEESSEVQGEEEAEGDTEEFADDLTSELESSVEEGADEAAPDIIDAIADVARAVEQLAQTITTFFTTVSAEVAAQGAAEAAGTVVGTIGTSVAEAVGSSLIVGGSSTLLTAGAGLLPLVYMGVAGVGIGIAALVAEIDGDSVSAAVTKWVSIFFPQEFVPNGTLGYLYGSTVAYTTTPGNFGADGSAGLAGSAQGGGFFSAGSLTVENTIVAGDSATNRSYTLGGYTTTPTIPIAPGSTTFAFAPISVQNGNVPPVYYPILTPVQTNEAASSDVAGNITSAGNNFIGVGDSSFQAAGNLTGTTNAPLNPQFTIAQVDQLDEGVILAYAGGLPTFNKGNSSVVTQSNTTDEIGQPRNLLGGVDIGAVEQTGGLFFLVAPIRPCR